MATCNPVDPPEYQTRRICIDGFWNEQLQQKYKCVSGQHTWEEWRDVGELKPTTDPC